MKYSLPVLIVTTCLILMTGCSNKEEKRRAEQAQALIEECKRWGDKLASGIIFCTDKKGFTSLIYDDLYRSKVDKRLPERARNFMQLHSLQYDNEYTLVRIEVLKKLGMAEDDPMIIQFHDAMKWADVYKAKSAEELFSLSQDKEFSDPLVRVDYNRRVKKSLLAIAKDKGYVLPE